MEAEEDCAADIVIEGTLSDNCDLVDPSVSFPMGILTVADGETSYSNMAEDDHGNPSAECTTVVQVSDGEPPVVDCGSIGVLAPCMEPVTVTFGADAKANGCPVTVTAMHENCMFCNGAYKEVNRNCDVTVEGSTATITKAGGVKSHVIFTVLAENDFGDLYDEATCTPCAQNPSLEFDPCGGDHSDAGNKYVCDDGFPDTEFTCARERFLRGGFLSE